MKKWKKMESKWKKNDNIKISANNRAFLAKISKYVEFSFTTPLEIIYKEQYGLFTKTTKQREKCPICMCEFYDNIIEENTQKLHLKDFKAYINHEIDTIKLSKCKDHFYHMECLLNFIDKSKGGFKCTYCQIIYGTITGDMPDGKMKDKLDKNNMKNIIL